MCPEKKPFNHQLPYFSMKLYFNSRYSRTIRKFIEYFKCNEAYKKSAFEVNNTKRKKWKVKSGKNGV